MYLVKSLGLTHRDAAIKNGSIRIGTINYYRSIEDDTRQDKSEGFGQIVWKGKKLTAEEHNKIFTPFDKVTLEEGWTIESDTEIQLEGSYPNFNAFTFCYSEIRNTSEISSTAGGKATHYYFIKNLKQFVLLIGSELKKIAIEMIKKHEPTAPAGLIDTLEVKNVTYRINYSNISKSRVVNEANIKGFDPKKFHPQDFFQKPKSFNYEKEVRTVWLFFANDEHGKQQILSIPQPDKMYVDLELSDLPISKKRHRNKHPIKTSTLKPSNS